MRTLAIARFTFREALRKKVLLGAAVLSLGFLAIYALGAHFSYQDFARQSMRGEVLGMRALIANAFTMAGLYVVNFLAGLLAIFTAVGTIASEIDSGTLHAILPKPVRRWEVILGKWVGFALMLVIYLALMAASVMLIVRFTWGEVPPQPLLGIALMSLSTLLLLSLTVLGSTIFSTVATGIVVFMIYGVGLMGGFIEQIGSLLQNETMVNTGIITSLIIPSDVLWKMASYTMQPESVIARAITTPFWGSSPPSPAMVAYAILYTGGALALATYVFRRRDL
jgi:Cu-processing system permease protein